MGEGKYRTVGKPIPRVDAWEKVTGETKYLDDIRLGGMLYGRILRSPHPHAEILRIDTERAVKLPGVKGVITAADMPRIKLGLYEASADKLPLEERKVRYVGDTVAAVAAVDERTAEEALGFIDVEYKRLPEVHDVEEALHPNASLIHENIKGNISLSYSWTFGDMAAGFRDADMIFEDTFTTSQPSQCYIETHGCIAQWDSKNKLSFWSSTQIPHMLRVELAHVLGIPAGRIRVMPVRVGGGFGGKLSLEPHEAVCAILAKKTSRPVKMILPREEEFSTTSVRVPMVINLKTGVKKDGTLTARKAKIVADNGAYNFQAQAITVYAGEVMTALYRVANVKVEGFLVYTNKMPTSAFRGYGYPQATFAVESQMDIIAEELGMNPVELRLKNANQPGDITVGGCQYTTCGLTECIQKATEEVGWRWGRKDKPVNRGLGISCFVQASGGRGAYGDTDISAVMVKVNDDGSVNVLSGGVDPGTGLETVLTQIVAEVLTLPYEDIQVAMSDTDVTPIDLGSYASKSTHIAGNAALKAAQDAKAQLLAIASEMLEAPVEELMLEDGRVVVKGNRERSKEISEVAYHSYYNRGTPILGRGYHDPDSTLMDWATGYARPPGTSPTYGFGAQAVEVEVNSETGEVKVLNAVTALDVGFAINPLGVEGQAEGGLIQGLGYALFENLQTSDGNVLNPNFKDYKLPTTVEIPNMKTIIVETLDPKGPFGAKGVGEGGLIPTAPAIANAIYDAVGVRIKDLPITPEKIIQALKTKPK